MKILITGIVFSLSHCFFAQPPENANSNSNVLMNVSPTINATEINAVAPDSTLRESTQIKSIPKRSGYKLKGISKASNSKVKQSQSIQSSQIIEQEYQYSRMQSSTRMISPESQSKMILELEKIEADENAIFEYNLYQYTLSNYDVSKEAFINKAERIKPNDERVVLQKIANECAKGDSASTRKYLMKLSQNQTLDKETIDYTQDVLVSSEGNDLLITHGTKDTYGAIYHQMYHPNNFPSKIMIVSLDLMRSNDYRNLLRQKGIKLPKSNEINTAFFKSFCALNANKKIAVSLTLPLDYLKTIAPYAVPFGLVLITGGQKELCLSDLEKLWVSKLNKRNLTLHKSQQAKNYAKNYGPTQQLLRRYEEQKMATPYMTPSNSFKKKSSKISKPSKN